MIYRNIFVVALVFVCVLVFSPKMAFAQTPNPQYRCPVNSTQVGYTPDTQCPLCRHAVTGEIFSVAECSQGGAPTTCSVPADCESLDQTCPINETFYSWACSTTDGTGSHCVKYCSGILPYKTDSNDTRTGVGAPPGENFPPPDLSSNNFKVLMAGQGRNTMILGDEDEFVETIFANAGRRFAGGGGRAVYEPYVRELYKVSVANGINPVIVLSIWGVEQSLGIVDGYEFGCLREDMRGFGKQVQCSTNTLNRWMNDFDAKKAQGIFPVPFAPGWGRPGCVYEDPFVYAYEAYTPVCTLDDGNDGARTNFVIYFKEFIQGRS